MKPTTGGHGKWAGKFGGFTLIELLTALLVLSLLALMSFRGLGAVLDAREHVRAESDKWRHLATFLARFERDIELASPRPMRSASGILPPWQGRPATTLEPRLEFSRFASDFGGDSARRIAYQLNEKQEIELWLWPGVDVAPKSVAVRYPVLSGVSKLQLQYLNANLVWMDTWPTSPLDAPLPLALRLKIVLASSEEIVRIFALKS
jgi:general secretion pathway protein J